MATEYSVAQIKILINLYMKERLTKTALLKPFWRIDIDEKRQWLYQLTNDGLIFSKMRPRPNVNKTPEIFFLTEKGKAWVRTYLEEEGVEDIKLSN